MYLVLWLFSLVLQFVAVCMCVFCNVCVFFFFDNCVGVLVICVLVCTVFCIVCTVFFIASFMYIYSYLFCLY